MTKSHLRGLFGFLTLLIILPACSDDTPITKTNTPTVSKPTVSESTTYSTTTDDGLRAIVSSSDRQLAEGALIDLNPHELMSLRLDDSGGTATSYQLFDSDGSLLDDKALRSESTIIDCSRLAKGKYRMHVTSAQEATLVVFEILITPL